jgi:N-acetylmuramoyl-L-alanine amidase
MKKKNTYLLFSLFLFLFSTRLNAEIVEKKIKVVLDEKTLTGIKLITGEEADYISLDDVKKIYDAKVHWYPVSGKVTLNLNGSKVEFLVETKRILVNGIQRKLDDPIKLINDEVFIPINLLEGPSWQKITAGRTSWDWSKDTLTFTRKPPPSVTTEQLFPQTTDLSSIPAVGVSSISLSKIEQVFPTEKKKNILRIVIDPGHGGKDPGAIGRRGTKEKEINLIVAKELANILRGNYGYEVILTRKDDIFLPLYDRAEIANRVNADLFVSIHCNASRSRKLNGFEVYFLSEKATDSEAEEVALRENAALALEEIPSWKQKEIEKILYSMETNVFLNQSSELAGLLAQHIEKKTEIINPRVRQASFSVLRGARMPAILVEVGFLTYRNEETKLRSQKYRKQIAKYLAESIYQYYQKNNNSKKASIQ